MCFLLRMLDKAKQLDPLRLHGLVTYMAFAGSSSFKEYSVFDFRALAKNLLTLALICIYLKGLAPGAGPFIVAACLLALACWLAGLLVCSRIALHRNGLDQCALHCNCTSSKVHFIKDPFHRSCIASKVHFMDCALHRSALHRR